MITRITGRLVEVTDESFILELNGIAYEIFFPSYLKDTLGSRIGEEITIHTIEYLEGTAQSGMFFPRLVGFLDPLDKMFFLEFVKVKGFGYRKALRAFVKPAEQIAAAIESGDARFLSSLPEIGRRTAEQLIASLRGKLLEFASKRSVRSTREEEFTVAQREALEVLIQLGEKRSDAAELISTVCSKLPQIKDDPARIVEVIYRQKAGKR